MVHVLLDVSVNRLTLQAHGRTATEQALGEMHPPSRSRAVAPGGLEASCPAVTLDLKGLAQIPPSVLQNVLATQEDLGGAHPKVATL